MYNNLSPLRRKCLKVLAKRPKTVRQMCHKFTCVTSLRQTLASLRREGYVKVVGTVYTGRRPANRYAPTYTGILRQKGVSKRDRASALKNALAVLVSELRRSLQGV